MLQLAQRTAEALESYTQQATRGKQDYKTMVNKLLGAGTTRAFIDQLTLLLETDGTQKELFSELVNQLIKMPTANVPLFFSLLRFKYAYTTTH